METRWIGFGEIELDGRRYDHDVVIDAGVIGKRAKEPSKAYRGEYGHTPLSADEHIPWGGERLIVGTGAYGKLPVAPEVVDEARRRGIEVVAEPTEVALRLVSDCRTEDVHAVLHITC